MVNVRRGINIRTSFAIQRNGIPEDLSQAQSLRVVIRHKCQPNSSAAFTGSAVKIEGNSVSVVVTDAMQKTMASGEYLIEAAYRLINPAAPEGYDPYIIDSDVFTLTDRSADVGGASCGDVTVQVVNLTGEVSFCSQALEQLIDEAIAAVQSANEAAQNANDAAMAIVDSKVDIDGLNANVKRLQFDTTNPTAPTQIGQIAWDNDEHTLVTHDGLHTHPLGKELELRARNTSGATILNGRACYVTGSTGDNPTIALATNTNGDVAQKTIGVATMDIANNSFGIVTTFGEVNGIDTSALTLGAIVYLGANGLLTTTEPVAPTPKIVIGLCVRQHAQVGKLFVSTRPIARLSKLSEVHAPALTDNDVLRYNGTTLRWEVYSLANKADLVGGKIPSAQLPAYVDDVLEYANLAAFPATGESGKIYVALNTNLTYRWSGTAYVEISKSLALGETADTAYRGDRGKTAYDHSQTTGNPHNTTASQIPNTPAGSVAATTVQGAINELAGDIVQVETDLNQTIANIRSWYGIEWDTNVSASACIRIGDYGLHQTLPVQSKMKRCLLLDTGIVNYYLNASDSTKKEDGTPALLDGTDGQVMVEIPEFFMKFEMEGTKRRCLMSLYPLPGFNRVEKMYISAYEAALDRTNLKLSSVVNNTAQFRGGNNAAANDGTSKTLLGRPVTTISLTQFRTYARNRGSINWNCNAYLVQKILYWLIAVEYGNFNNQLPFNPALTSEGYRQGGLSIGVTDIDGTKGDNFNGYQPFIPCGHTNLLGNSTGVVSFQMPVEYDAVIKTVSVPTYRGVENPFGHVWKWTDGCKCNIQSDASGGLSEFYVCTNPANFQDADYANYVLRGLLPRTEGYIKSLIVGEFGEMMPLTVGASSTTYMCDYFYTSIPASGVAQRGVLFGGYAYYGATAGVGCSNANPAATYANANIGSRLCYLTL